MKLIQNNSGFALITALMFTMLSLVITMTLLYMVSSGIRTSSALKKYKTTTEAAYGGVDIMIKDIIGSNIANAKFMNEATFRASMTNYVAGLNSATVASKCLQLKLTTPTNTWPADCTNSIKADETSNDLKFNLNASDGPAYNVYAKIVDTEEYVFEDFVMDAATGIVKKVVVRSAGNSDVSPKILEGAGVTENKKGTIPPQPYVYRIEIQAGRPSPSMEKSKISVQYVY